MSLPKSAPLTWRLPPPSPHHQLLGQDEDKVFMLTGKMPVHRYYRCVFLFLRLATIFVLLFGFVFLVDQTLYERIPHSANTSQEVANNGNFRISQRTLRIGVAQVSSKDSFPRNGLMILNVPGDCQPLYPTVLLFNRIFKTASTTMMDLMKDVGQTMGYGLRIGSTEDWYDTGRAYPYPGIITTEAQRILARHERAAFAAHFYFRGTLALRASHTYINQVREPVSRVVSHYFYMHTSTDRPKHRIQEMIESGEYNETLEECFHRQHKGCQSNVLTRFFCGEQPFCRRGSGNALAQAKENIKRYYASVGLVEHFDVYLQILHKRLPHFFKHLSDSEYKSAKITPAYDRESVSAETIELIRAANHADIQLYEYIKKLFWEQAKNCLGVTEGEIML